MNFSPPTFDDEVTTQWLHVTELKALYNRVLKRSEQTEGARRMGMREAAGHIDSLIKKHSR